MLLLELEAFRASDQSAVLSAVLIDHLGVTQATIDRESNGTASDLDTARLTVLRFLFGTVIMGGQDISDQQKIKALVWIRRQKLGRFISALLSKVIIDTRYTYESTPASESVRILLQVYKQTKEILYSTPTEVLYVNRTKK